MRPYGNKSAVIHGKIIGFRGMRIEIQFDGYSTSLFVPTDSIKILTIIEPPDRYEFSVETWFLNRFHLTKYALNRQNS